MFGNDRHYMYAAFTTATYSEVVEYTAVLQYHEYAYSVHMYITSNVPFKIVYADKGMDDG